MFDLNSDICIDYVSRFKEINKFVKSFRKDYSTIVAYHGTNLNEKEIELIRKEGLFRSSLSLKIEKAKSRFILPTDKQDTKINIANFIDNYFKHNNSTTNEINFGLLKDPLINEHYQYLLFGTETILILSSKLKHKFNIPFRKRMSEFGSSYVIKTSIPVSKTNDTWIKGIYEFVAGNSFNEASLIYQYDLHAKHIISIEKVDKPFDRQNFMNC